MILKRLAACAVLMLMAALVVAAPADAEWKRVRKADNVIFCLDTSGSMMSEYKKMGETDLTLARKLLQRMSERIPDMGFKSGLCRFSPFTEIVPLDGHSADRIVEGLATLPEEVPLFGAGTPMGDDFLSLAWPISKVPGPTAIVLFTDGGYNEGQPPVPVAEELYKNYNICLHIISFANSPSEQVIVDELMAVNPCSVTDDGWKLLGDDVLLEQYIRDVLWTMVEVNPKPMVEPEPEPVRKTVSMELLIEYDYDKFFIRDEYMDEVTKLAEFMKENTETEVLIVGHTDNHGSHGYNITLSENRANSVREALMGKYGIDPGRIKTVGYGFTQPIATNDTDEGRQRNRRVLAHVTGWYLEKE